MLQADILEQSMRESIRRVLCETAHLLEDCETSEIREQRLMLIGRELLSRSLSTVAARFKEFEEEAGSEEVLMDALALATKRFGELFEEEAGVKLHQ